MKIIIISITALLFSSCLQKNIPQYTNITGFTQGTTYSITYENKAGINYSKAIDSVLSNFDLSLSAYNQKSLIWRINNNDTSVIIDTHFKTVFLMARYIWKQTNGALDITVAPIVNALGFGTSPKTKVDSAKILSLFPYIGMHKVQLRGNKIIKTDTAVKLDVNSIAQGYSVDVLSNFLESKGIQNYMVEIGGEVKAKGKNSKGMLWRIGIDKPEDGNNIPGNNLQLIIKLNNKSITTAGNYRKFYVENGIKYSHIINPKTGFSAKSNILSVTIVANNCITADAWDTALIVVGLDEAIKLLAKHPELDAYIIYSGKNGAYNIFMTNGFKRYIN